MTPTSSFRGLRPTPGVPFVAFALFLAPAGLAAQNGALPPEPLTEPYLAWDRGDYVDALEGYLRALEGADEALEDRIALLTGELYAVDEVAPDGQGIVYGPSGRYVAYEVVREGRPVTVVHRVEEGLPEVAALQGTGAVISPGGWAAYRVLEPSPELERARAAMEEAGARGDRAGYFTALGRARWLEATSQSVRLLDLASGEERTVRLGGIIPLELTFAPDGETLWITGTRREEVDHSGLWALRGSSLEPESVPAGPGYKSDVRVARGGRYLVFERPRETPAPLPPDTPSRPDPEGGRVVVLEPASGERWSVPGTEPALSADGSTVAFLVRDDGGTAVHTLRLDPSVLTVGAEARPREVFRSERPVENLAVGPDGSRVTFQVMPFDDWEVFVASTNGQGEPVRVTKEIQHDLFPRFLTPDVILAVKGEGRHRRSYLYNLETGAEAKLFHNNTVRTIAPEYEWAASPDGYRVLIVSERDGDTVSPERGVYLVDLTRKVTADELRDRLERNLASERALEAFGRATFAPVADAVRAATEAVSVERIFRYEADLFEFGSKYITQPGNRMALEYLEETLRGWGYEPELQWFEPRPGLRTGNVIVRITGTVDPELVYVASSHFDSVERGPGADDNSSGTSALLEVARVLKGRPQPASIELAFFTGEEAGLLGSREYVRRAVESGKRIAGALNNDMVGWAENHRLDNTIRYSNPGIRDIQHAAASMFSDLITYDALYYKNTDAHAYYEVYGDIVGGIGSHPVLGNPHYHQATDRLSTINHRLVAEVARTTAATLMLLASSPSRIAGLEVVGYEGGVARLSWDPAPETGVEEYEVRVTGPDGEERTVTVDAPEARLDGVRPGSTIAVRGINAGGMPAWDWARIAVGS